jgi:hypothetical protein
MRDEGRKVTDGSQMVRDLKWGGRPGGEGAKAWSDQGTHNGDRSSVERGDEY